MKGSKAFLKSVTTRPGVYQMLGAEQQILYVGKAKNLRNRLTSYFQKNVSAKTARLMTQVVDIDVIITETENEALLLECNLIKKHKPRYNILLRDDKSYPYIFLSNDRYPMLGFYRGAPKRNGRYFGPYPSTSAVRDTLNLLQKLFLIRQCKNTFFANRSRPCLQYQIGRCSGPCVEAISTDAYASDVQHAILFLEGKDQQVIDAMIARMQTASKEQAYETAAFYRDKIANLKQIQEQQVISQGDKDVDVIALAFKPPHAMLSLMRIRRGRLLETQHFRPKVPAGSEVAEVMQAFITQYYLASKLRRDLPGLILLNHAVENEAMLIDVLSAQAGKKVQLSQAVRGERARWLKLAVMNAEERLMQFMSRDQVAADNLQALQEALSLLLLPQRIECFDISHTSGQQTMASCVVYDNQGLNKQAYRRFKITTTKASDDYAAINQAVSRRFKRLQAEGQALPDILLIDGGKGQVNAAQAALDELQITTVLVMGIAKGKTRKPGLETLFIDQKPVILARDSKALHLLQQIRDEAHRFAIQGHRKSREESSLSSRLQDVPGIGAAKRRELLTQFGGLQGVARASVEELCKVKGISKGLAEQIYALFHAL